MASSQSRCDPVRSRSRSPKRDDDDDDVIVVFSDNPSSDPTPIELLDESQVDVVGDPLHESILQQKIQEWMSEQLMFPERFRAPRRDMTSRITRLRGEPEKAKREIEEEFQREVARVNREIAEEYSATSK